MQTLVLIRHAIAGDRAAWSGGDDAQRPLTAEGRTQAKRIAKIVVREIEDRSKDDDEEASGAIVRSLRSSPSLRCIQSVEPLAERAEMEIEIDEGLLEGHAIDPPSPREGGVHILCAHGDNIPWLLDELNIDWNGKCKKGSIWFIQRDRRGKVLDAQYERSD